MVFVSLLIADWITRASFTDNPEDYADADLVQLCMVVQVSLLFFCSAVKLK